MQMWLMMIFLLHLSTNPVWNCCTEADGSKYGVKVAVPVKYLSNFWRSLEKPFVNCKVELWLKWIENCVLTTPAIGADADAGGADSATFKITDANFMFLLLLYQQKIIQN